MRPLVATTGGWVGENGSTAVSTCLDEDCLGQLKIEVCSCLRGLIGDMRCMALWPPALIPERGNMQKMNLISTCTCTQLRIDLESDVVEFPNA